jgi:4-hydroxy-tetrahydrodipicolinate synthase
VPGVTLVTSGTVDAPGSVTEGHTLLRWQRSAHACDLDPPEAPAWLVRLALDDTARAQSVVAALGDRVTVLCGDDALTVGMMAVGAKGVISVASNALPGAVAGVCRAMLKGDLVEARRRQEALLPLYESMFLETNPGPVKAALAVMGRIPPEIRLPMAWPAEATVARVTAALREQGVAV